MRMTRRRAWEVALGSTRFALQHGRVEPKGVGRMDIFLPEYVYHDLTRDLDEALQFLDKELERNPKDTQAQGIRRNALAVKRALKKE